MINKDLLPVTHIYNQTFVLMNLSGPNKKSPLKFIIYGFVEKKFTISHDLL
uniref:BLTX451 n=1 Tax=Nephila pilipes TaxID=299642 RepID=A0A076L056_NEPPI|nr:BLTX451 [Nephila pilipes]